MLSPYAFVANNPIILVDPDGRDIVTSTTFNQDGSKTINIVITGKLINNSTTEYTQEQMGAYAQRLSESIITDYTITEPGVVTNVTVNLTAIVSEVQLTETDHAFRIVDDGKIPNGKGGFLPADNIGGTPASQNVVYIAKSILNNEPAVDGAFAGTGLTETGQPTLERTGPHEVGHSAKIKESNVGGGFHPTNSSMPGNLMNQSSEKDAGTKITRGQVLEIEKNYNNGKLNKGKQEIK